MSFDESHVRTALIDDERAIAEVHVGAWKTTYQSIFPPSVMDALSVEQREKFWTEALSKPALKSMTLVACDETDRVVGFASGGAERTGRLGCDGELYAIYLDAAPCWYAVSLVNSKRIGSRPWRYGYWHSILTGNSTKPWAGCRSAIRRSSAAVRRSPKSHTAGTTSGRCYNAPEAKPVWI